MKERIRAISLVHERMYRDSADFDGHIDFTAYLVELVNGIAGMMGTPETPKPVFSLGDCGFRVAGEVCVDLGLVINELVTNAYKHAVLPGRRALEIDLAAGPGGLRLTIRDHGPGLPEPDTPDQGHLGMTIVRTILSKYGTHLLAGADGGAWVGFDLPLDTTGLVTTKDACAAD
jgi:two-component sensor histidine kinase